MNTKSNDQNVGAKRTLLASCQNFAAKIEHVKNNIVAEFRDAFEAHEQLLRHAVNQADALAWQTEYPHLFFPTLAAERIQAAAQWNARQQFVQRKTDSLTLSI